MQWKKINPIYHIMKYLGSDSERLRLYEHQRCIGDALQLALSDALKNSGKSVSLESDNDKGYKIIVSKNTLDQTSGQTANVSVLELVVTAMDHTAEITFTDNINKWSVPMRVGNSESFHKHKDTIVEYAKKF
jgi:hypothetical protein